MVKVITYGTYDLLHEGHIRLLKRAKALGDYLIVGVTSDSFDRARGKINVAQPLIERIAGVKSTGIADEIVVEEYEGQKIDDIVRLGVDIFTVGSDWVGTFDYLREYCEVVYLDRTQGISSTDLRSVNAIKLGLVGEPRQLAKVKQECSFVNGLTATAIYSETENFIRWGHKEKLQVFSTFEDLIESVDAVYLISHPSKHESQIRYALNKGKHVLCETPISFSPETTVQLLKLASEKKLVLMDALKTAYSTAFERMLLIAKSGKIGDIVSVDATCTSLTPSVYGNPEELSLRWSSMTAWGPTAMLPIFLLLGTDYKSFTIQSIFLDKDLAYDSFSKIDFTYERAVASALVGKKVKSEGDLTITGTKGYVYVPAPWWKTDYFEIRYEDASRNQRYFWQLDGEGIRYELSSFLKRIRLENDVTNIPSSVSVQFARVLSAFCDLAASANCKNGSIVTCNSFK